jgi:hypothetical protein
MLNTRQNIKHKDITFVFQGPIMNDTRSFIDKTRNNYPESKFILSTFSPPDFNECYDHLIIAEDPGSQIQYRQNSGFSNLNRQITTSQNGLKFVKTPYAIKIRTDCYLEGSKLLDRIYKSNVCIDEKILAISYFTIHPAGIEGLTFHISDWFFFGKTLTLRDYFDVKLQSTKDASWHLHEAFTNTATRFDKKYHSKFAPEQYLSVKYAQKKKYITPSCIGENSTEIKKSYRQFVSKEFVILEPELIGLKNKKLDKFSKSNFNRLNCISNEDWININNQLIDCEIYHEFRNNSHHDYQIIIKNLQRLWCGKILRSNSRILTIILDTHICKYKTTPILIYLICFIIKILYHCRLLKDNET